MPEFRYSFEPAPGHVPNKYSGVKKFAQYFPLRFDEYKVEVCEVFHKHKAILVSLGTDPLSFQIPGINQEGADNNVKKLLDDIIDVFVGLENTEFRFRIKESKDVIKRIYGEGRL